MASLSGRQNDCEWIFTQWVSKYMMPCFTVLSGETDKSTVTDGDFNNLFLRNWQNI